MVSLRFNYCIFFFFFVICIAIFDGLSYFENEWEKLSRCFNANLKLDFTKHQPQDITVPSWSNSRLSLCLTWRAKRNIPHVFLGSPAYSADLSMLSEKKQQELKAPHPSHVPPSHTFTHTHALIPKAAWNISFPLFCLVVLA